MAIPRYPKLSREYLDVYWLQWWWRATGRKPRDDFAVSECSNCGSQGILGYELVHVGPAGRTNLFCTICRRKLKKGR